MDEFDNYSDSVMTVNGLTCTLHMPEMLAPRYKKNPDGTESREEIPQGLPRYAPRRAFKVDEYECPPNWEHGSSLAGSYFVPVQAGRGLWLDFSSNRQHTHDVAVVVSIQGVNPITGASQVDGDIRLEQYRTQCPKHNKDFKQDRFCEECGYKWAGQNYLSTTSPGYSLWIDGVMTQDGEIRQYYFTEEEAKGFAHQVISKEKKVYAIGVAFYLSKEEKPKVTYSHTSFTYNSLEMYGSTYPMYGIQPKYLCNISTAVSLCSARGAGGQMMSDCDDGGGLESFGGQKSLDIALGSKINQKIYDDPKELSYWQEKPAGFIYVNYCPMNEVKNILLRGKKDLTNGGEGFLKGLKVGV
jgi:hypothetical protein